jgi:hypothetical protein
VAGICQTLALSKMNHWLTKEPWKKLQCGHSTQPLLVPHGLRALAFLGLTLPHDLLGSGLIQIKQSMMKCFKSLFPNNKNL